MQLPIGDTLWDTHRDSMPNFLEAKKTRIWNQKCTLELELKTVFQKIEMVSLLGTLQDK